VRITRSSLEHIQPAGRRSAIVALSLWVAVVLGGCATPDPNTPAGEIVASPVSVPAGTVLTYSTFNAYNGEPRAIVRQTFGTGGSRIEGMDYETAGEGGFGITRPRTVNRVLDAQGSIVRLERADGSSVTYDPPLRALPFPLRPGTRFRQQVVARESDGSAPRKVIVAGYVTGWETVTVPAGQFRVLRIVRDSFLGDHQFYRTETIRQEVDWYSPEAGSVVRSFEDSRFQDMMSGGGDDGAHPVMNGDWLRWELQSVSRGGPAKP
jgi:hypothetical protein